MSIPQTAALLAIRHPHVLANAPSILVPTLGVGNALDRRTAPAPLGFAQFAAPQPLNIKDESGRQITGGSHVSPLFHRFTLPAQPPKSQLLDPQIGTLTPLTAAQLCRTGKFPYQPLLPLSRFFADLSPLQKTGRGGAVRARFRPTITHCRWARPGRDSDLRHALHDCIPQLGCRTSSATR